MQEKQRSVSFHGHPESGPHFLTIGPALPAEGPKPKRAHSTLGPANGLLQKRAGADPIALHPDPNGLVRVARTRAERDRNPDRISLDRRGLTQLPMLDDEPRLRLLSLQHNLLSNLEGFKAQKFPFLVFLDLYDNQLEKVDGLDGLGNLRVLLIGKNRYYSIIIY